MRKRYKIGFTAGVFDLLHEGHLNILTRAKEYCETLVVAVTTDDLCKERKGLSRVPINGNLKKLRNRPP